MKRIKLFSQLLISMLAIAALGTSCESDTDDLNVAQTYTISFKSNGGTDVSAVETVDGLVNEPTAPEMEGYTFAGWYSDSSLETQFDFSSSVTGNITLYAKWSINSYTVSFYTYEGDSSVVDQSVEYGAYVTEPNPEPTREGYTLYDWYTEEGERWKFASDKMGTSDMTLYAKWDIEGYKIRFYTSMDGDYSDLTDILYDQYNVEYNTEITYKTITPDNTDIYTFGGWYDNPECEGDAYEFGVGTLATADLNLYAKWVIASFKVTFELGNGEFATEGLNIEVDADNATMVDYGSTVIEPDPAPTNGKFGFIGWYTDETYTTEWDFETMTITAEATIYAKWVNVMGTAYFFNVVGAGDYTTSYNDMTTAEAYSSESIEVGSKVTELFPADEIYNFVGWFTASNFDEGSAYDFDTEVTDDLYLYAKWEIKTFAVTFEVGDGAFDGTDPSTTISYGYLVSEPSNPTHETLTFGGWYTEADGEGTEWDFETMTITAETTLYAYWKDIAGSVSYYNVDEAADFTSYSGTVEVYETAEILMNQSAEELAAPTSSSTDYVFDGWYTADDFESGEAYTFPEITEYNTDLKLYAKYKLKTFKVTFDANGGTIDSEVENPQIVEKYQTATSIDATYGNYPLQGWYYNGSLFDFDTQITSDITLTAEWVVVDYAISNEADLIEFRTAVNAGATSATAYLTSDITIKESNWTPIGTSSNPFIGTFDGNNKTIYGLTISASTAYQGLFGALGGGATIQNCTISDLNISTSYNSTTQNATYGTIGAFAGGVVTSADSIYLTNLTVADGTITGGCMVGGIIGATSGYNALSTGLAAIITDCVIESDVTITKTSGNYVGGITSTVKQYSVITNCQNRGAVVSTGGTVNGGILGAGQNSYIIGCSNVGSMTSSGNAFGGIMGTPGTNMVFIGCYNTGYVGGAGTNAGGIGGQLQASGVKLYACYGAGTVEGSSANVGQLIGNFSSGASGSESGSALAVIEDCFAVGTAIGNNTAATAGFDWYDDIATGTIEELNAYMATMNANATFSATDYYYTAGISTPTIATK